MNNYYREKKGFYRSRNGLILGVCKGFAEAFNLSTFWVRCIMVIVLLLSGLWPVIGVYIVAALLMKPEPVQPIENEEEQEFYDSYAQSPHRAAQRLKKRFQDLERRIRRMEDVVTGREFRWNRKYHSK
jgi:phage shock protein C